MFLVLEVIGPNAATLGAAARVVFTAKGGTIAVRAGNDWVLGDPHVSGRHARVRSVGGTFFSRMPRAPTVCGQRHQAPPGEPFPLKDGDSIFIDPFEISVRMTASMPGAATEAHSPAANLASPMTQAAQARSRSPCRETCRRSMT